MPSARRVSFRLAALVLAALCLAGCGNKGPLVKPPPPPTTATPAG